MADSIQPVAEARTVVWLLAAVVSVYAQALVGPLQFDDYATLAVDPTARALGPWWAGLAEHVRPLTKLSFVATHGLGRTLGDVARGHHLGSILIHVAAVLVLLALVDELLRSCVPDLPLPQRTHAAFAAALLFAVHPVATEAVSYLSGRSMALGSLFGFLSLLAWIRGRRTVAALALAAAVLARETMAITVLLVLLWEWARSDRPTPAFTADRLRTMGAPLFAAAATIALVGTWLFLSPRYAGLLELSTRIAADRVAAPTLLTALGYFAESLLLLRYPNIDPDVTVRMAAPARVAATAVVAGAFLIAWRIRDRRPEWLLGLGWILACIAPLYFVHARHDWIAERHFYPALAGAATLVGTSLARLSRGRMVLLSGIALACGIVTMVRNADYRSEITLWEATARHSPEKVRVLNNLGAAYLEAGRWADAESVLQEAVEIDPGSARAVENLRQARERRQLPP